MHFNEDKAHCSAHTYWANGCPECKCAEDLAESIRESRRMHKAAIRPLRVEIGANASPKTQLIQQQLARVFGVFFARAKNKAAATAGKEARKLQKADEIKKEDAEKIALLAWGAINWEELVNGVYLDLLAAAQVGIEESMSQLGAMPGSTQKSLLELAEAYAKSRSVEMIGKQYINGKIYDDQAAKFVIADTTRDDLVDIVENVSTQQLTIDDLEKLIRTAKTFSDARAQLIATTETSMAQVKLHVKSWKTFGVRKVNIELSPTHPETDECDDLAAGSPYEIDKCPFIPAHPHCQCTIVGIE